MSLSRKTLVLLASMLVTGVLGSVHAFSVFIVPFEQLLGLPRSDISLIYSLALVAITLSVLLGYRLYSLVSAWWLIFVTCLIAAAGLVLAASASNWWILVAGYSVAFGLSNGVGYGFSLQLVGRVMPERKGFAMGAVTAAYAVGSIVFAKIFAWRIALASAESALLSLAVAIAGCGIVAAIMLYVARARYGDSKPVTEQKQPTLERRKILQFWLAYMTSVFAGLMAIGHAAGIALTKTDSAELATLSAIAIGAGSTAGGFLSGWLVDRWPSSRFLVGLPLLSAIVLLGIGVVESATITVELLAVIGFSYGSIIAIYPVVISDYFSALGAQAYGRVFIAWGFAGLVAPWSAGVIYDLYGGYEPAMIIAAVIAVVSAGCARIFRLGEIA